MNKMRFVEWKEILRRSWFFVCCPVWCEFLPNIYRSNFGLRFTHNSQVTTFCRYLSRVVEHSRSVNTSNISSGNAKYSSPICSHWVVKSRNLHGLQINFSIRDSSSTWPRHVEMRSRSELNFFKRPFATCSLALDGNWIFLVRSQVINWRSKE